MNIKRIHATNEKMAKVVFAAATLVVSVLVLGVCASCGNKQIIYEESMDSLSGSEAVSIENEQDSMPFDTTKEDSVSGEQERQAYIEVSTVEAERKLVVHLCGAVNNAGVYELDVDSRIIDGIKEAGGLREDACADALNLALPLEDGSRVYIPTMEEVQQSADAGNEAVNIVAPSDYVSVPINATQASDTACNEGGLVNINTADEAKLTTLKGIGAGKAKAIIEYRTEHGGFDKIEDIMQVRGIKQAGFDKIKDSITVK